MKGKVFQIYLEQSRDAAEKRLEDWKYLAAFSIFRVIKSLSMKKKPTRICRNILSNLCPSVVVFSYACRNEVNELSCRNVKKNTWNIVYFSMGDWEELKINDREYFFYLID